MKTRIKVDSKVVNGELMEWFTPQYRSGNWLMHAWCEMDLPSHVDNALIQKHGRGTLALAQAQIDYELEEYARRKAINDSRKTRYIGYP